jgi:hypothetical protein
MSSPQQRNDVISDVTITGGHVSGPSSSGGGINSNAFLTLDGVAVVGNSAPYGAGIDSGNPLTITNSLIARNTATIDGGGVSADRNVTISNSTITGNTAGDGSGVAEGGGIYFEPNAIQNSLLIAGTTIADNTVNGTAGSLGGNLVAGNLSHVLVTIGGTIIARGHGPSTSSNCAYVNATVTSLGHNIDDSNQCMLAASSDEQGTDPMLGMLAANPNASSTLGLLPGSPAINDGGSDGCKDASGGVLTIDQRGVARPQGAACDSGAFEFRLPSVTGAPSISGTGHVGDTVTCAPAKAASPDGGGVTSSFTWLRDGSAISGATGATYQLASADGGHELACRQASANAAGSVSATSANVSVSVPPPPALTLRGKTVTVSSGRGSLNAGCSAPTGDRCLLTATLYSPGRVPAIAARNHKRKPPAQLGSALAAIAAGSRGKLTIRLNKAGKALLAKHARLKVQLVGTVSDHAGETTKLSVKLTLKRRGRGKHEAPRDLARAAGHRRGGGPLRHKTGAATPVRLRTRLAILVPNR